MTKNLETNRQINDFATDNQSSITYAKLSDLYCVHLQEIEKSEQEIKNARVALKSWRESMKFQPDTSVSKELSKAFETYIKRYINSQNDLGISKNTCSSRVSLLRAIRSFYLNHAKISALPDGFGARLRYLLELNGYSLQQLWEHHLKEFTTYGNINCWMTEKSSPSPRKLFVVEAMEKHLKVPAGTLTSTLKLPRSLYRLPAKFPTKRYEKYAVFTESLGVEFQDLIEFKTSVVLPSGMNRRKRSLWTGEKGKMPPSAEIAKGFLSSFFGFLCLPADNPNPALRGRGFDAGNLSLALLTDAKLLEEFITVFSLARSGGKYNHGAFTFILLVTSLLRKDTGYLYQKPEFAVRLGMSDDAEAWRERCLKTRRRLVEIKESIEEEKKIGGESFGFGRDPEKRISAILQSPRPIKITMKMVHEMLADVEKMSNHPMKQAILFRDTLLIAMLQANPLRLRMLSNLKFGVNLIKREDGSWWLKFNKSDFKNRPFLKSDYQVRVTSEIWQIIDDYADIFRKRFPGSEDSAYVFLSDYHSCSKQRNPRRPNVTSLSGIVCVRTRQYIPGCGGFRPHAFRHIVATDIIKSNPGFGFFLAAKVLHDKLETVERCYAHLKTSEYFEPYNQLFSETWNSLKSPDAEAKGFSLIEGSQDLGLEANSDDDK